MNEKSEAPITQHLPIACIPSPDRQFIHLGMLRAEGEVVMPIVNHLFVCIHIKERYLIGRQYPIVNAVCHPVIARLQNQSGIYCPIVTLIWMEPSCLCQVLGRMLAAAVMILLLRGIK